MDYEDPLTALHDVLKPRPNTIFLVYFKPKTNKLNDVLVKDPRVTRFDIVGRTVMASFILGYKVLKDTSCIVYIDADRSIAIPIHPEDVSSKVFMNDYEVTEVLKLLIHRGSAILNASYQEIINTIQRLGYKIYYLHEGGVRIKKLGKYRSLFILGTNIDAPKPKVEHELISIGTKAYQANHVVTYINWLRLLE